MVGHKTTEGVVNKYHRAHKYITNCCTAIANTDMHVHARVYMVSSYKQTGPHMVLPERKIIWESILACVSSLCPAVELDHVKSVALPLQL